MKRFAAAPAAAAIARTPAEAEQAQELAQQSRREATGRAEWKGCPQAVLDKLKLSDK